MKTKKSRVAVTISMPEDMAKDYENLAKRLAKNKSLLFREMFLSFKRRYLKEDFQELQTYGAAIADRKGILTESDVEKLVFQGR